MFACVHVGKHLYGATKSCWLVWLVEFFPELNLDHLKHWGGDEWLCWPNGELWALGATRERLLWAEQGRRSTSRGRGGGRRSGEGRGREVRETRRGTLASDGRRGVVGCLFLRAKEWRWTWIVATTLHFFLLGFYPYLVLAFKKLLPMRGTLHAPPLQLLYGCI